MTRKKPRRRQPKPGRSIFAQRLSAYREAKGRDMSQTEFAAFLGIPKGTLVAWENDYNYPTATGLALLRSKCPELKIPPR